MTQTGMPVHSWLLWFVLLLTSGTNVHRLFPHPVLSLLTDFFSLHFHSIIFSLLWCYYSNSWGTNKKEAIQSSSSPCAESSIKWDLQNHSFYGINCYCLWSGRNQTSALYAILEQWSIFKLFFHFCFLNPRGLFRHFVSYSLLPPMKF